MQTIEKGILAYDNDILGAYHTHHEIRIILWDRKRKVLCTALVGNVSFNLVRKEDIDQAKLYRLIMKECNDEGVIEFIENVRMVVDCHINFGMTGF